MAIEDTVILPAGRHEVYSSRKSARSYHTAGGKKGGNYSLHHIIPYRYPCFVGMLVEHAILKINTLGSGGRDEKPIKDLIWWIGNVQKCALPRDWGTRLPDPENLRHEFAWMGCNLFTGPSGVWRLFDPGSNPEPLRPQSFPASQWGDVLALGRFLDSQVIAWERGGDDEEDASSTSVQVADITFRHLKRMLIQLNNIAAYKDAHPFTGEDWLIVRSRHWTWTDAYNKLNSPVSSKQARKEAKKKLERMAKADTPSKEYAMPISYTSLIDTYPDMPPWRPIRAIWRLRKADETVPKLKMTANFVLQ